MNLIGKSQINDFLGTAFPENLARKFENLRVLRTEEHLKVNDRRFSAQLCFAKLLFR